MVVEGSSGSPGWNRSLLLQEEVDEIVVDLLLHHDARAGVADLALIAEDAVDGVGGRLVQVGGVAHDDLRGLAAAFGGDPLHVGLAGIDQHQLADLDRAGDADLVDVHVQAERLADLLAHAVDDVEHAGRAARFHEQLGHKVGRQRRLLGRLQDHGVAGGERRRHLPRRHHQRVVPGHDGADDADRLPQDHLELAVRGVGDVAVDLVDRLAEELQGLRRSRDVAVQHVGDRLAHVEHVEQREFQGVVLDQVSEPVEHVHAAPIS
jgi:ParB family chromosome partitioning protein